MAEGKLIIPSGIAGTADRTIYRCACGTSFPSTQKREWAHHVGHCEIAEQKIQAAEQRRQGNAFGRVWDREQFRYHRGLPEAPFSPPKRARSSQ